MRFILILLLLVSSVFGIEIKHCYIADPKKHAHNQEILCEILKDIPVEEMSVRIEEIATLALEKGFEADAYAVPLLDENSTACFNMFPLWEGKEKAPLTFFVYVWPAKEWALKHNRDHDFYSSNIHGHAIPCALATLQGTMVQKNFCLLTGDVVRLIDEEKFPVGKGAIDDLSHPFIHQLYGIGTNTLPCLSLHAYGSSTASEVMRIFKEQPLAYIAEDNQY